MDNQRICKYCGNPVKETANFCGQCGHNVATETEENFSNEMDSTVMLTDIITGIRRGDNQSFQAFYDITNKKAYSVAYQMLKKEDEAFDMLQDAYIKAYNKIDTVENPERLISWFNMIVANTCRDQLKKNKPVLFNELDSEDFEFEETLENQNEEFVPEAMSDYNETKRLMTDILDNLSPEQKLCTLLYYYDELSIKEIAAALECSENTVKSRLNYARQKIKEDVLDLEKKGTKLYGIAPIPFIVWMLKGAESTYAATDALYAKIASELWTGTGTTVAAETVAATSVSEAGTGISGAGSVVGTKAAIGFAGKSAVATATVVAGKSIVTKVIAGIVAVSLIAGGGITINKVYDSYQQEKISKQYVADEQTILTAIDEEYLENLLCYLPVFDEDNPIQTQQFQLLIDYSLAHEGFNRVNSSLDLPTVLEGAEGVECDIREGDSKPLRSITAPLEPFYDAARLMNYDVEITEDYIKQYDPTEYAIDFEDDQLKYIFHFMGLTNFYWEADITNISNGGGKVAVSYQLYFSNMLDGTEHRESRAAMIRRAGDGYVVEEVEILGEPDGALSIMDLANH